MFNKKIRLFLLCVALFGAGLTASCLLDNIGYDLVLKIGPRLQERFWAAQKLAETEDGIVVLHKHVANPDRDKTVRAVALSALCADQKPWESYTLLSFFQEPVNHAEYRELLNTLDYAEEHQQVVDALQYEYRNQNNRELRSVISNILQRFEATDYHRINKE